MISIEQLAEVIRDNIEPGAGPLGDLWLDCAKAVVAAIAESAGIDAQRLGQGIIAPITRSTLISEPKVSIPMPKGAAPLPPRSSMSDDERELLWHVGRICIYLGDGAGLNNFSDEIRAILARIPAP